MDICFQNSLFLSISLFTCHIYETWHNYVFIHIRFVYDLKSDTALISLCGYRRLCLQLFIVKLLYWGLSRLPWTSWLGFCVGLRISRRCLHTCVSNSKSGSWHIPRQIKANKTHLTKNAKSKSVNTFVKETLKCVYECKHIWKLCLFISVDA